jgi:hypothetical protein
VTVLSGATIAGRLSRATTVSVGPEKSSRRKMWRILVQLPCASPADAAQLFSNIAP